MTEQEIIRYLKENRNKGVAFGFMPRDVTYWCCEHHNEEIFHLYYKGWNGKCGIECIDTAIYCLDEDYEPKPETHYKELDKEREEMTENEIVDYLKENKTKGVAFNFMPEEVKAWCGFHSPTTAFRMFNGVWSDPLIIRSFNTSNIYCLADDYEPKPEFKGYYEEFEIKNGRFYDGKTFYLWHQWADFLTCNHTKYNDFGGWFYNDIVWSTKVLVTDITKRELYGSVSKGCKKTIVPVRPTKIRFWRYAE